VSIKYYYGINVGKLCSSFYKSAVLLFQPLQTASLMARQTAHDYRLNIGNP